ncbi:uncharacterized protein RJT20DRAFT_51750 [Scheffersomyces xylosifermentans]|uniref:uncharacterized protein n=1 Tax=Scheffersomyces xylosifermentans TaxID=1304137 RepID=UPI00315C756E
MSYRSADQNWAPGNWPPASSSKRPVSAVAKPFPAANKAQPSPLPFDNENYDIELISLKKASATKPGSLNHQSLRQINPQSVENIENYAHKQSPGKVFGDIRQNDITGSTSRVSFKSNSLDRDAYLNMSVVRKQSASNIKNESSEAIVNTDEVFYEASPVFENEAMNTDEYRQFEIKEEDHFKAEVSPKYDANGKLLPCSKYFPTLLSEAVPRIVQCHRSPHMTKPLTKDVRPLNLSKICLTSYDQNAIAVPLNLMPGATNEEACILSILTHELEELDLSLSAQVSGKRNKLWKSTLRYLSSFFTRENYYSKYPWAQIISEYKNDQFNDLGTSNVEYDLDEVFAYIYK